MTTPRERPILFSGPMVRAILGGHKTQTRRVVLPGDDPIRWVGWPCDMDGRGHPERRCRAPGPGEHHVHYANGFHWRNVACPYGATGDRLWVREAWRAGWWDGEDHINVVCRADDAIDRRLVCSDDCSKTGEEEWTKFGGVTWRPSIHMPRWASRLTLEVADVRVERLHAITEEDACAEGVLRDADGWWCGGPGGPRFAGGDARDTFAALWQDINGKRPGCAWSDDPWVWVVGFQVVLRG